VEKPLGKCPVERTEKKCEDKKKDNVEKYAVRMGCR
jgi:hypothetical protein